MSVLALQGCSLPYNSPARFMGRLDPETLATIEPPLHDDHPDWPTLKGQIIRIAIKSQLMDQLMVHGV